MDLSVKKNQLIVTGEELDKYLYDVCELEKAIYLIDETISSGRRKFDEELEDLNFDIKQLQEKRERDKVWLRRDAEKEYKIAPPTYPSKSKLLEPEEPRNVLGKLLGFPIAGISVGISLLFSQMWGVIIGLLAISIGISRDMIMNSKEKEKRQKEYKEKCLQRELAYERAIEEYEADVEEYMQAKEKYINAQVNKALTTIDDQIAKANAKYQAIEQSRELYNNSLGGIMEKREYLQARLFKMYNYGLIPVDYRTVDCVIMLSHIFRNGLTDNMRDAINLYETRVYRGEMVRGMNNIQNQLSKISAGIGRVGETLKNIFFTVDNMSSDLCKLVADSEEKIRLQGVITDQQQQIIAESQLNRHVMKSLVESNENLEYYARKWDRQQES